MFAVVLGFAAAAPVAVGPASSAAAPTADVMTNVACGWSPRIGAATLNIAYPDTFANYWETFLPAVPGTSLTVHGDFPHARYMSFTSYAKQGEVSGSLNDQVIAADSGNVNPFRNGGDRKASAQQYTVRIVAGAPPTQPEANTLYTGDATGLVPIIYRVYRPDIGLDATGGAGLPRLTVTLPDGTNHELSECGATNTALDPHKVYSPRLAQRPTQTTSAREPDWKPATGGGHYPNPDNKYLATVVEPGRVAVIRGMLPTTPATYHEQPIMGSGQVRYWSLCSNNPASTAVATCVVDDETAVDSDGLYTIVVSTSDDRPANTAGDCGIGWLSTDAGSDLLIMRNMLPASDFRQSIQNADPTDPRSSMGSYHPEVHYTSKAEFEATGCPPRKSE
ncbi:hypothetical protein AB0B25_24655 [Nocardia sp. NPDC049190]|uniref:hypothetical protein n=1 Tax=Nocardia sp. NPDC049190 TaxID=3155650 RepID=UPI0033CC7BEB